MCDHNYQRIPKEFYSFETNKPFDRCIECGIYLLDNCDYIIEKAIKQYPGFSATDTIFDYAICLDCAMRMRNEFSKGSLEKIDNYFGEKIGGMPPGHITENDLDISSCLSQCLINKDARNDLKEYQIYAYCKGDKLFKGVPPYMIGGPAIEEILPLLSNPTTDFLNGFYNKHFSPDPSMMNPDPNSKLVFI